MMGYEDRDYYRSRASGPGAVLQWLWSGRLSLFHAFGIHVQAHAMLVVCVVLGLLLGFGPGFGWQDKFESASLLFAIVLLHEFGHCFACRWVGGEADEIVMHPLGGLALCVPPRRPWPSFVTSAGGPLVNVAICGVCAGYLFWQWHTLPGGALMFNVPMHYLFGGGAMVRWVWWTYVMSLSLLAFNLLPVFPLDGGRMLQEILWPIVGYYRSMKFSCVAGMIVCVPAFAYGLITGMLTLTLIAAMGFYYCYQMRQILAAEGPGAFEGEFAGEGGDYRAAYEREPRRRKQSRWTRWRISTLQRQARAEQAAIDRILAKVSAHGMQSLSWWDRRTLKRASDHQRRHDRVAAQSKRR
jgi:stage IV sporulation protein FB